MTTALAGFADATGAALTETPDTLAEGDAPLDLDAVGVGVSAADAEERDPTGDCDGVAELLGEFDGVNDTGAGTLETWKE